MDTEVEDGRDVVIVAESPVEEGARAAPRFYFDLSLGAYVGDVPSDIDLTKMP